MRSAALVLCQVLLFLPGCGLRAAAGDAGNAPPAGFAQGNALYAAGRFAPAAAAYERAVRAGPWSANLFYDLGNAYERLGQRGRAILNYQRALLLEPAHTEARANLAFVQGRSGARKANPWLSRALDLPEIDLWPLLAAAAGWAGGICLVVWGISRPRRLAVAGICFAVCAAAVAKTWWLDDGLENPRRAVVVVDRSRALYAPADNSKVITVLGAGAEVRVLSAQGAWVYAQLADGSPAWLAAADVEKVVPVRAGRILRGRLRS